MPAAPKVFGIILAGGEGKRLMPLTADRAKPAVPFGGQYRLIDFAISNLINSGLRQLVVLTQYKSHSLDRHISQTWRMSALLDSYVASVPAQQRLGKRWFSGSADAILQSLNLINDEKPDIVVVIGADHVYRMDFRQMLEAHIESGARATVAGIRQPISLANQFGVIDVDGEGPARRSTSSSRSRRTRPGLADSPGRGARLDGQLHLRHRRAHRGGRGRRRAADLEPRHGRRHHPLLRRSRRGGRLRHEAQRRAGLDRSRPRLLARRGDDRLVLRRPPWTSSRRCRSSTSTTCSGRSTRRPSTRRRRSSCATRSGASATRSTRSSRSARCCPGPTSSAAWSGRGRSPAADRRSPTPCCSTTCASAQGARIHRAILDKNVVLADGATVGVDRERDIERGFTVTDTGITVVGKGMHVDA